MSNVSTLTLPLYLLGLPAAGKTTLGRAVAQRTGCPFIDLDEEIERLAGLTIPVIFAERGEAEFRHLESRVLRALPSQAIVACGGGTPCFANNMDHMLCHGTVIWLTAQTPRVVKRLMEAEGTRPLARGKTPQELQNYIEDTLRQRTPYYSRAHATFDATKLDTPEEVNLTVARFLQRWQQGWHR